MTDKKQTIYVIGGPTASGKSARALDLAAKANGVIINADSLQIYDALPTLTAHPSPEEHAQIPHELYGTRDPAQPFSAGNWREAVMPLIDTILQRGQTPIVVGGSGLYIKALMEGFSPVPDIPDDIRAAAAAKQKELGNPAFHAALKERDPVMAERFHPYHTARLVRAWEVLDATGKSLAVWQEEPVQGPPAHWQFDVTLVMPEREILRARCDRRFDLMMENGALDEVRAVAEQIKDGRIPAGVPLTKALGYKELAAYLAGTLSLDEAIDRSKAQTRQFAKRQVTWFRHQIKPQKQVASVQIVD